MKTNRFIFITVLSLLPLFSYAQSLFNKYSDMNNVSSVYISKAMIEMNPELYAKDINIGRIAKQLELVQILSTMDNSIKREMRRDIEHVVYVQKYELLMKQKGLVSRMAFYVQRKGERVRDLIMVIDGAANLKYIRLMGDMTLKDIQNIMETQNTSEGININTPIDEIQQTINLIKSNYSKTDDLKELKDLKKELDKLKKELKNENWSYVMKYNKK